MSDRPRSSSGAAPLSRAVITVTGIVQGVGFRPFVYQQASTLGLAGRVINTSAGVTIDVEGGPPQIESLIAALKDEAPPRALITGLSVAPAEPSGAHEFVIAPSERTEDTFQLVSPDSCTCDDCLAELFDPADRRYRYPFTNCTNCGPRFTIIESLPYDRHQTTMQIFKMCPACQAEYENPANRRFHAEPNACPECGPRLWLAGQDGSTLASPDVFLSAAQALHAGKIVALKGLGGFQLACLATDGAAVATLRRRKRRPDKPFAVMVESLEAAREYCRVSADEAELLQPVERPIVLMKRRSRSDMADEVAPGLDRLGLMLPYTPLHFLLLREVGAPLVMTSGNPSQAPICRTNDEAIAALGGIADLFLLHNRAIRSTYDDSVVTVAAGQTLMIRRARGYAPLPLELPQSVPSIFASGADLKSTFCLTREGSAFISQHIGDLASAETLEYYERTEELYEQLFDIEPRLFACDRHPDYLSTGFCNKRGGERQAEPLAVQHHQAHIASCLAENGSTEPVIGIALDGTGYGDDGCVWGGEFFHGSLPGGFTRVAQLEYFPLLGGEAAIHEPWRTALALTWRYAPEELDFVSERLGLDAEKQRLLLQQLEAGLNSPLTSSCGRLFDGVAALLLGRHAVSYEAQAAIELEAQAARVALTEEESWPRRTDDYRLVLKDQEQPWQLSPEHLLPRLIAELKRGAAAPQLAYRFHRALADTIVATAARLTSIHNLKTVALSGGVFQNRLLLELICSGFSRQEIQVLSQHRLPPNDGGLALGQAALACYADKE